MDVAQDTYKDKPPLSYQKKCVGITFFPPWTVVYLLFLYRKIFSLQLLDFGMNIKIAF